MYALLFDTAIESEVLLVITLVYFYRLSTDFYSANCLLIAFSVVYGRHWQP